MRKIQQYKRPKFKNKIVTLIIMILVLVSILVFGRYISDGIAAFVAPGVAVSDDPMLPVSDSPGETDDRGASPKAGTVMARASKNAAQNILNILAGGTQK